MQALKASRNAARVSLGGERAEQIFALRENGHGGVQIRRASVEMVVRRGEV